MVKVALIDFFSDNCKYRECEHNREGFCSCNNIHHYQAVIEGVADNYGTKKGHFYCINYNK